MWSRTPSLRTPTRAGHLEPAEVPSPCLQQEAEFALRVAVLQIRRARSGKIMRVDPPRNQGVLVSLLCVLVVQCALLYGLLCVVPEF